MGHISKNTQLSLHSTHWRFRYRHGGSLRKQRFGRFARPLSTKDPIHLVFKAERKNLRQGYRSPLGFAICQSVIKRYAKRFFVKIEQQAICNDHIHLLVRFSKRSLGQHFLRVVAGQIAQQLKNNGFLVTDTQQKTKKERKIWKHRPFSRVVISWKAYQTLKNYIKLNEKEGNKEIAYKKERLKGLSSAEWELLWE